MRKPTQINMVDTELTVMHLKAIISPSGEVSFKNTLKRKLVYSDLIIMDRLIFKVQKFLENENK